VGSIARPEDLPTDKRILCFSPQPDDDVISMDGTMTGGLAATSAVLHDQRHHRRVRRRRPHRGRLVGEHDDHVRVQVAGVHAFARKVTAFWAPRMRGAWTSPRCRSSGLIRPASVSACRSLHIPRTGPLSWTCRSTRGRGPQAADRPDDIGFVVKLLRDIRPQWIIVARASTRRDAPPVRRSGVRGLHQLG